MGSMETSRRNLLKAGTAAAAAVAAAPLTAQAAVSAENTKFDATYDVVVVGSGFAGMACAYKAAKAGLSVLMIEKMVPTRNLMTSYMSSAATPRSAAATWPAR